MGKNSILEKILVSMEIVLASTIFALVCSGIVYWIFQDMVTMQILFFAFFISILITILLTYLNSMKLSSMKSKRRKKCRCKKENVISEEEKKIITETIPEQLSKIIEFLDKNSSNMQSAVTGDTQIYNKAEESSINHHEEIIDKYDSISEIYMESEFNRAKQNIINRLIPLPSSGHDINDLADEIISSIIDNYSMDDGVLVMNTLINRNEFAFESCLYTIISDNIEMSKKYHITQGYDYALFMSIVEFMYEKEHDDDVLRYYVEKYIGLDDSIIKMLDVIESNEKAVENVFWNCNFKAINGTDTTSCILFDYDKFRSILGIDDDIYSEMERIGKIGSKSEILSYALKFQYDMIIEPEMYKNGAKMKAELKPFEKRNSNSKEISGIVNELKETANNESEPVITAGIKKEIDDESSADKPHKLQTEEELEAEKVELNLILKQSDLQQHGPRKRNKAIDINMIKHAINSQKENK